MPDDHRTKVDDIKNRMKGKMWSASNFNKGGPHQEIKNEKVVKPIKKEDSVSDGGNKPVSGYRGFIGQCLRDKGGGADAMKACAKEWRENKDKIIKKSEEGCSSGVCYVTRELEKSDEKKQSDVGEVEEFEGEEEFPDVERSFEEPFDIDEAVKMYLLTFKDCPGCEEAKEHFKEEIESGEISIIDIDSDKGVEIINALNINGVPKIVIETSNGSYCLVSEDGTVDSCHYELPEGTEEENEEEGLMVESWKLEALSRL